MKHLKGGLEYVSYQEWNENGYVKHENSRKEGLVKNCRNGIKCYKLSPKRLIQTLVLDYTLQSKPITLWAPKQQLLKLFQKSLFHTSKSIPNGS